jgi:N-methylhydantoinase A
MNTSSRGAIRVAIDIGGTFTDFVIFDAETGELRVGKVLSSPHDPVEALIAGIERLHVDLANVEFFVHGTTVGLNAVVEERGANVGLVTTRGFRDTLEIGLMEKKEMYNLFFQRTKPLVPRRRRFEVDERVDGFANVLRPVDAADVRSVAEALREAGVESVAVVTLNAYLNSENEASIGRLLAEALGANVFVSVSHQIANEWREFERASTTVLNAYVLPVFRGYLQNVRNRLAERGLRNEVNIMKSSGGIMTSSAASTRPIHSLLSGPVGGAVGAQVLARRSIAREDGRLANVVTADMGGTSFDAALIIGGEIEVDARAEVAGYPMLVPAVRVSAIGAGGGSIARVEGSAGLRVGPESAGAAPGPACYGRGGAEPTVTDANLVLGRLGVSDVLGGEITLDADAAAAAVRTRVAEPLGLDVHEAAEGILRVINTKMALAIRELTVAQGLDPADFAMLAFGGAGPMHACEICAEIGIRTVVVPPAPGMFSAWGMLAADVRHDLSVTMVARASDVAADQIEAAFVGLEAQGREELAAQQVEREQVSYLRSIDLRYVGQEHTLSIPVESGVDPSNFKGLFDDAHRRKYGHASEHDGVEMVNLRLAAVGAVAKPEQAEAPPAGGAEPTPLAERQAYFNGALHQTPVYERSTLARGTVVRGPAVVDEEGATTIVPPNFELWVDDYANLVISSLAEEKEGPQ